MSLDHDRLRGLVLIYEELGPDERRLADAHLNGCADCSSLLVGLQDMERAGRLRGSLPEMGEADLKSQERAEADASLAALHARLRAAESSVVSRAPRAAVAPRRDRRRPWEWTIGAPPLVRVSAALAALAAVWILWPRQPSAPLVGGAELARYSGVRGAGGEGWRTGDAFVIRVRLTAPARLVVFHVGPAGEIDLLYPDRADVSSALMPAGTVTLPPERSGAEWKFEGSPGAEAFLVGATARKHWSVGRIAGRARALPQGSREERIRALVSSIELEVGPVQRLDAAHQP